MIKDLDLAESSARLEADVVIVGGGAVGLSMFADRVRRGESVLLVEAGGRELENSSQELMRAATSSGRMHEGVHTGRFRVLGGTTHFWGGQLGIFDPIVFEQRAALDDQGWPFGYEELEPHYRAALSLLGMDGGIAGDAAVCSRGGVPLPDMPQSLCYFFTRWIREPSLAEHFKHEIEAADAPVLVHANVIGFSPLEDGVHELRIRTPSGRALSVQAKAYVLACGTMEISRLLLLPYADGSPTPWQDNIWVGRGYYDHIDVCVGSVAIADKKNFDLLFENIFLDGYKYNPKLKLSEEIQREEGLLQACGAFIFSTSYKEHAENLRHFIRSLRRGKIPSDWTRFPGYFFGLVRVAVPMALRYIRSSRAFHPKSARVQLRITTEQVPIRESAITLGKMHDPFGVPVLDLCWRVDGREMETVARCAEEIKRFLESRGLATVALDPRIASRDRALLDEGDDTNHQMGGARISADRSSGVVDANLLLFGARDVYVAGAAVMPTSGFVNCTLTAIALGLRLNAHLRTRACAA